MSDIPDAPVSHNDQIRNILADLIEKLAGTEGNGHAFTDDGGGTCVVCAVLYDAQTRLRKFDDE